MGSLPPNYFSTKYNNITKVLDMQVRKQLSNIFPSYSYDIQNQWIFTKIYNITKAQPSTNIHDLYPANVGDGGGRDCTMFYNEILPHGLYVCGDCMSTASFNGALESGINAGNAVIESFM